VARGTVLQYGQESGCGYIASDETKFAFTINQWQGKSAPALNRVVEINVQQGALVSVAEVPEEVLAREKAAELAKKAGEIGKGVADQGGKVWERLVASVGLVTVIAQIVYAVSIFGLPAATIHFFGMQGSLTLYDILSNPLADMPALFMWCLYASCAVVLVPMLVKKNKSWLILLLPLLILLIVGYEGYAKVREMVADNTLFGQAILDGIKQIVSLEVGCYTAVAAAVVLAAQGIRKFLVQG
jgi:hypothetical protein